MPNSFKTTVVGTESIKRNTRVPLPYLAFRQHHQKYKNTIPIFKKKGLLMWVLPGTWALKRWKIKLFGEIKQVKP